MDWPDIQLFLASYADNTDGGIFGKRDSGLTDEYYAATFEKILYQDAYSVLPLLMRPKSRGTIRLKSSNPNDPPLIDPKYFDHPDDIKVLIEGAKFGYEMSRTSTMRAMNATLNPNGSPDCLKHGILTDAYWECQVSTVIPLQVQIRERLCGRKTRLDTDRTLSLLKITSVRYKPPVHLIFFSSDSSSRSVMYATGAVSLDPSSTFKASMSIRFFVTYGHANNMTKVTHNTTLKGILTGMDFQISDPALHNDHLPSRWYL